MNENGEPTTGEEVDSALNDIYYEMIDDNARIVQVARETANMLYEMEQMFASQLGRCQEARALVLQGAQIVAGTTADVVAAEWGIVDVPGDEEGDLEEVEQ